jgi:thiosulfate/3-mercaptopyruvate sulfurtransferase
MERKKCQFLRWHPDFPIQLNPLQKHGIMNLQDHRLRDSFWRPNIINLERRVTLEFFASSKISGRDAFLVETTRLAAHLQDPALRIVDMRGYVRTVEQNGVQEAHYVGAREEYEQGHIPGALYIDWTSDIVDTSAPVEAQIAPAEQFAQLMGNLGIGDQHLVVAYDAHPASQFATRLWWALKYYGHERVVVLNGGLSKWKRENLPLVDTIPVYAHATFTPVVHPELRATAEDVLQLLGQQGVALIDARESGQYTGALVRKSGRPGHIPGTLNIPREEVIDSSTGTFRSNEELAQVFTASHVLPEQHVVAYCNGGVAATTILFSLAMPGYPSLTNYDGSWNEWGERQDLPVELQPLFTLHKNQRLVAIRYIVPGDFLRGSAEDRRAPPLHGVDCSKHRARMRSLPGDQNVLLRPGLRQRGPKASECRRLEQFGQSQ